MPLNRQICVLLMGCCAPLISALGAVASEPPAATNPPPLLSARQELGQLDETVKRISKAVLELESEYNQRAPDLDDIIMDPVSSGNPGLEPMMLQDGKLVPPRPRWVNFTLQQISQLLTMLGRDLQEIAPLSQDSTMKGDIAVMNDTATALRGDDENLQAIIQADINDRAHVLKTCKAFKDDLGGLSETGKRLLKIAKEKHSAGR